MSILFSTRWLIATLSSSLLLTACGGGHSNNVSREQMNTMVGSVLGGVAGHQFGKGEGRIAMTVLGTVLGGYIGGQLGRDMNRYDHQKVSGALESVPNNQKVTWNNPTTQSAYVFTPVNTYEGNVNGQRSQCRDYVLDARDKNTGQPMKIQGRSCRNAQGQWVSVN
ncbi:MAG: glycine zipper 2TM domain-containing protein [Cocleimonas sp.]|nr:glycine zipper 2TM domain-containing protein [Cocleimonas sp.]